LEVVGLLLLGHYFFLRGFIVAAFSKAGLLLLGATGGALGAGDDVNDYFTIVFAAIRACTMRYTQCSAFAFGKSHTVNGVMTTAFGRLGTIATHADYHAGDYTDYEPFCNGLWVRRGD